MQFIVIAYDGTDEKVIKRRMAVRENHLNQAKKLFHEGNEEKTVLLVQYTKTSSAR